MKKFKTMGLGLVTMIIAVWGVVLMISVDDKVLNSLGLLLFCSAVNTLTAYLRLGLVAPDELFKK